MKYRMAIMALLAFVVMTGCKNKADEKKEGVFPVLSFIKNQVAHVDTSLYQIIKLTQKDSITWDTTFIKREEFRSYAKDFLDTPDLTDKQYADKFQESKFFDATLNQAVFTYTPKNKDTEIQREEITIEPGTEGKDKVKNIFIDKLVSTKDSTITKRMLWMMDNSFQITTIVQKTGQPDSSNTMKVKWQ